VLIKNPRKHVLTDYRIASLLGHTKHDPKTSLFVDMDLDGSCKVYRKLSKTLNMPVEIYSPTSNWAQGGEALEKFGRLLAYSYEFHLDNAYNLLEAMRMIVELHAEGDKQYDNPPLVEMMFGPEWFMNTDLI
jgi:hypothetical protein